jgi:DNA-binding GntR family transcriptional regulator
VDSQDKRRTKGINTMSKNNTLPQTELKKNLGMEVVSLADLVTTQIREMIITGEFKSGQPLKEDELCKLFSISRPPIREAFKTLEANGLVTRKPRKGVSVSEFVAKDVEEVYTIVAMLYCKATEMAMESVSNEHLKLLANNIDKMAEFANADPPNLREFQAAHRDFHEIILDLAGNQRMKQLEKQLRCQISIFSYKSFQKREHLLSSLEYHRRILAAIGEGKKTEATALMEEHVMRALKFFLKKMPG